jgi:hypothetical protein
MWIIQKCPMHGHYSPIYRGMTLYRFVWNYINDMIPIYMANETYGGCFCLFPYETWHICFLYIPLTLPTFKFVRSFVLVLTPRSGFNSKPISCSILNVESYPIKVCFVIETHLEKSETIFYKELKPGTSLDEEGFTPKVQKHIPLSLLLKSGK